MNLMVCFIENVLTNYNLFDLNVNCNCLKREEKKVAEAEEACKQNQQEAQPLGSQTTEAQSSVAQQSAVQSSAAQPSAPTVVQPSAAQPSAPTLAQPSAPTAAQPSASTAAQDPTALSYSSEQFYRDTLSFKARVHFYLEIFIQ